MLILNWRDLVYAVTVIDIGTGKSQDFLCVDVIELYRLNLRKSCLFIHLGLTHYTINADCWPQNQQIAQLCLLFLLCKHQTNKLSRAVI